MIFMQIKKYSCFTQLRLFQDKLDICMPSTKFLRFSQKLLAHFGALPSFVVLRMDPWCNK